VATIDKQKLDVSVNVAVAIAQTVTASASGILLAGVDDRHDIECWLGESGARFRSFQAVIPAKAGIHLSTGASLDMDPSLRWGDTGGWVRKAHFCTRRSTSPGEQGYGVSAADDA
jgi:hypothetical protein